MNMKKGLTLMEVMFSILVITVGLLGVSILLPLAGRQIAEGVVQDKTALVGRAALKEFRIRGMANPANWCDGAADPVFDPDTQAPQAFCIDPRFVARNAGTDPRFPYSAPAGGGMPRISLLAFPGDSRSLAMTGAMADEIFMSKDSLSIQPPESAEEDPYQFRIEEADGSVKRAALGRLSWFATLVPLRDNKDIKDDRYTLSIVVLNMRDNRLQPNGLDEELGTITAANFLSGGYGGGEVVVSGNTGVLEAIQEKDWLFLSGSSTAGKTFGWYRVLRVGDVSGNSMPVTLDGADWDPTIPATVTIVRGVRGVYEETIRLESSSRWNKIPEIE